MPPLTARPRGLPCRADHWVSGCYRALLASPSSFYADTAWAMDGLARFRVFHKTFYAVADPDLLQTILVKRQKQYRKGYHYENAEMLLGRGLVTVRDETEWAEQRTTVAPAFHRKAIQLLVEKMLTAARERFARWAPAGPGTPQPISVVPEMRAITQRVISETLFGTPVEATHAVRFSENLMEAGILFTRKNWSVIRTPNHWPTPLNRRLNHLRRQVTDFLHERIALRRKEGIGAKGDVLDLLLASSASEASRAADDRIAEQMLTLFAAGYDTTSSALSWCCGYLAREPAIQAALQAEVDQVLGDRPVTLDALDQLTFTDQVFNEALRLHPPVHTLARTAVCDEELGGCRIPAGSHLMLSIFGAHRSPKHWTDPEAFLPERFAPDARPGYPRRAFLPFSAGHRRCIGALFANLEAKLVLVELARSFHLSLGPKAAFQPSRGSALYPSGLVVAAARRDRR